MRFDKRVAALTVPACMAGAAAAMIVAAPSAAADPVVPDPVVPVDPAVAPVGDPAVDVVAAPPAEVPHLTSPENLPPGTSATPVGPQEGRGVSYLRELWHAVQTQDVSGSDALLLLTQRPLNTDTAPPAGALPEAVPPGAPVDPAVVPVDPAAVPVVDPAVPTDPALAAPTGPVAPLPATP